MNDGREDTIVRRAMTRIFDFGSDQAVADFTALVLSYSGFGTDVNPNALSTGNPPGPAEPRLARGGRQAGDDRHADPVPAFGQLDAIESMIGFAEQVPGRTDPVVKGLSGAVQRGWFHDRILDTFLSDLDGETISAAALRALTGSGTELTYTVVPRGSGLRIGLDRDEDGFADRTETLGGADPADPLVTPDDLLFAVALNGERFAAGDTLELSLVVLPGSTPPTADAQVLLEQPSGGLLYLQSNGTLTPSPTSYLSSWTPVSTNVIAYSATIADTMPPGNYVWHTRLFEPGTFDLTNVSAAAFEANVD